MSFVKRVLNLTFKLGEGAFGTDGSNQVDLKGLRISAKIVQAGGASLGTADIQVWGMTLAIMNQLSTLGFVPQNIKRNLVSIQAGNEGEGDPSTVFQGTITSAWIDAQQAPLVGFRVTAQALLFEAVVPAKPSSFTGGTAAEQILSGLADQMGLRFENNGVTTQLDTPYYYGSPLVQARQVIEHAGIEWNSGADGILAIWPRGGSRGQATIDMGPEHGLVGYPTFNPVGLSFQCIFNPNIGLGSKIKLTSSLKPPSPGAPTGTWVVYALDHDLEAQVPKGMWFSSISAAPEGFAAPPR